MAFEADLSTKKAKAVCEATPKFDMNKNNDFIEQIRNGEIAFSFFVTYINEYDTVSLFQSSDNLEVLEFYKKAKYPDMKLRYHFRVITKDGQYYFEDLKITEGELSNFPDNESSLKNSVIEQLANRILN